MIIANVGEQQFSKVLDSRHSDYIYQPMSKKLEAINYRPDFYVPENNCYYEVIGCKQGYHNNKDKILKAKKLVNLLVIKPNGELYTAKNDILILLQ